MIEITLPKGIEIVQGPYGPRFKGAARALRELASQLRILRDAPLGFTCRVGSVTLYVTDNTADIRGRDRVSMPPQAWNILASKFTEVTYGWEDSPFDFRDCGYLSPPPEPDLGVELDGDPESD